MATHSCILAWRIPTDRGALAGYSPRGRKESDTTERLSTEVLGELNLYWFDLFFSNLPLSCGLRRNHPYICGLTSLWKQVEGGHTGYMTHLGTYTSSLAPSLLLLRLTASKFIVH